MAASQKITSMTISTNKFAAGTKTLIAVVCSADGTAEAIMFKKATTKAPIMPQAMAIFFGLCIVSATLRFLIIKTAVPQLGMIR